MKGLVFKNLYLIKDDFGMQDYVCENFWLLLAYRAT